MNLKTNIHAPFFKKKLSVNEIKKRIFGLPFELISTEYTNAHEKLEWQCLSCKTKFSCNWVNFSSGWRCPNCKRIKASKTMSETQKRMGAGMMAENIHTALQIKGFVLLENISGYIGNLRAKRKMLCTLCNNIAYTRIADVIRKPNPGCWDCNRPKKESHWAWKNSSNKGYPREWTVHLRDSIRNRDGWECQYPNCQNKSSGKNKLHVHHIDGDKQNCNEYNLITICAKHHIQIEKKGNRDDWKEYFYSITYDYLHE